MKLVVELSEFDFIFKSRTSIKCQALVDFKVEFTNVPEIEATMKPTKPQTFSLFVDV